MNTDLTALKPALVWKHFAAMTQIPRPSFHEEKIRRYVLDVARSLGLECGVIGGTYPKLDMISFGPTICYPHSPDERVEIASVGKFYEFLLHTLKHIPVR